MRRPPGLCEHDPECLTGLLATLYRCWALFDYALGREPSQDGDMTATRIPRFRQATIVARDLEPVVKERREALPLGDPFREPVVGPLFGIHNAVMPLGDTFVEVISPVEENTAAGRHLDRLGGGGGCMAMFQVDDLAAARDRIEGLGLRLIFDYEVEGDTDLHIHPNDVPGAIITLDHM